MSAREIRRLNRSRVSVLWGATRTRYRQYGSAEDRRLYMIETANWKRMRDRRLGEARRVAREFEATMASVTSAAGATPEEMERLEAQILAKAPRR